MTSKDYYLQQLHAVHNNVGILLDTIAAKDAEIAALTEKLAAFEKKEAEQ